MTVATEWESLRDPRAPTGGGSAGGGSAAGLDLVVTEELGDDPLSDGLLPLARCARAHLLRPHGLFSPRRVRIVGVLASVRTTRVSGFDLRAFNAFRVSEGARCAYDLEHLQISEPGVALAAPEPLRGRRWRRAVSRAGAVGRWRYCLGHAEAC